jgi:unsaturated chondroitin disaccharide hydrolase
MKTATLLILASMISSATAQPAADPSIDIDKVMRVAARKLAKFDASQPERKAYPTDAKGAEWTTVDPSDWVSGFYPGALWYVYEHAKSEKWPDAESWRKRAESWTAGLEAQQFNDKHHDTGFMIFDSYGNGNRITGNPTYPPVIIQTAKTLASRYREETGMIRSWGKKDDKKDFTVIIDNMMNLELLMWASEHGGEDLRKIAISHADRTRELFFRPDGSLYHVVQLDPADGKVRRKRTQQGKADESAWSRGQTWAIYGFTYMHEATGDPKYLESALKAADYYLAHLPEDQIPPSDFNSELQGLEFKDSSAATVAAAGLLRLYPLLKSPELQARYLKAATASLCALTAPPYFSEGDDKASLVAYAARNYHADPNHKLTNTSLIWSDYYLLQALLRYQQITAAKGK